MRYPLGLYVTAAYVVISACSGAGTLGRGTAQDVLLRTDPLGATCTVEREGRNRGEIETTPGTIGLGWQRAPIEVSCNEAGLLEIQAVHHWALSAAPEGINGNSI